MTTAIINAPNGHWSNDAGINQAYLEHQGIYIPMYPQVFSPFPVDGTNGEFARFSAGNFNRLVKTQIPVEGGMNIDTLDMTVDNYKVQYRSLEVPVGSRIKAIVDRYGVNTAALAQLKASNAVQISMDQAMLENVNTTNLPLSGNTGFDATAAPWSNPASDVLSQFVAAGNGLDVRSGASRRIGFGNIAHKRWLSNNTGIGQRFSVTRDIPGVSTNQTLAETLGLDDIVFFDQTITTSNPALSTEVQTYAWPTSKFLIATVANDQDLTSPCLGRSPYWTDPAGGGMGTNAQFIDARAEAMIARQIASVGFKIMDLRFGYLIGNIA